MLRNRKKRITCESDMMEGHQQQEGRFIGSSNAQIKFLEEVNYKME